jgi:hypothetical protein
LLLRTKFESDELTIAAGSSLRQSVERAKEGVLRQIKRRWLQIQAEAGFNGLEVWALKEISDGKLIRSMRAVNRTTLNIFPLL